MKAARLLAGAAVLALAACGASVDQGEVTDKYYEEAHTYYVTECLMVPTSNGGTRCQPYTAQRYEPEHYVITLTNCDLRESSADDCPSERHYVDPGTYERTQVGDQLDLSED